jgi:hypothetical protein
MVTRPVGVGRKAGETDERQTMIGFIIANPSRIDRWHVFLIACGGTGPVHDGHSEHLSIPINHGVKIGGGQADVVQMRMDDDFCVHAPSP